MAAPAPKAPEAATVTCQASPASSSRPSQSTRHLQRLRGEPRADRAQAVCRAARAAASTTQPLRAAGAGRPALATFTNGRSWLIQPSSSSRRRVPRTASSQAADEVGGQPEPVGEVVRGARRHHGQRDARRACGRGRRRDAAVATRHHQPVGARPRRPARAPRCRSVSTLAPDASRRAAHSSGSLDPERSFATSATAVVARAGSPCVFPDAPARAMLLALMGAHAPRVRNPPAPRRGASAPRGRARRGGLARAAAAAAAPSCSPARRSSRACSRCSPIRSTPS